MNDIFGFSGALLSMQPDGALECREMSSEITLQKSAGECAKGRSAQYAEKSRAASQSERLNVYIGRSRYVCLANPRLHGQC
jgi:hypothetical protein